MQNSAFCRDNLGEQKILESAFLGFQRASNQNFGNYGATSRLYKPPFLSYSEVGTYTANAKINSQYTVKKVLELTEK